MFIEFKDDFGSVCVNMNHVATIRPFEDENEREELFKTGVIITFSCDAIGNDGETNEAVYHGVKYDELLAILNGQPQKF